MLIDPARLTAPVDDASPCGEDLEYDAAFIALQDAAETRPEQQVGGSIIPAQEPDWPAVARDALDLLDRCRDLRIASILAESVLRTDGLAGFAAVLEAVRGWLEQYWDDLHPRLDPDDDNDPTMRVNAMTAFSKLQTAEGSVLRALRAAKLTNSRGFGRFTWRDLLIATGEMPAPEGEQVADLAKIGQKFIARNRAPRVQIEYDVEVYGAEKKVQLPFVMGVMADLSGSPKFRCLRSTTASSWRSTPTTSAPAWPRSSRARSSTVPNTLTGEGNISVDITFESMDDFTPGAIARKVEPLRELLEARTQLSNLMTYMDGKSGAEDLIARAMQDPALLKSLAAAPAPKMTKKRRRSERDERHHLQQGAAAQAKPSRPMTLRRC
jgi:type VI secretion system protein ImpB